MCSKEFLIKSRGICFVSVLGQWRERKFDFFFFLLDLGDYRYVSGEFRLAIGELSCKFDTGGYYSITHTFRNQILMN